MVSSFRDFIGPSDYGYHLVKDGNVISDESSLRPPAEGDAVWHDGMGNWFQWDRTSGALAGKIIVAEEGAAPTNVVGTGHIAGAVPGEPPPVSKKRQSQYRAAKDAMARRKIKPLLDQ